MPSSSSRLVRMPLAVPPLVVAGDAFNHIGFQPKGLAHIAQGTAGAVGNNGGSQRGAVASIFVVQVLNDLFSALVLEVDIDIRWLVALFGNEALEQQG